MKQTLALALVLATGCFRITGTMHSSTSTVTKDLDTVERRFALNEQIELSLSASVEGNQLVMSVERSAFCNIIAVTRSANIETEKRTLPGAHWGVLAGGVAFAATGGTMIVVGGSMAGDLDDTAVGTADEERERDKGRALQLAGAGAIALGAGLLVSELIDYLSTGETHRTLAKDERTDDSRTVECGTSPAPGVEITVRAGSHSVSGVTDQAGRLVQPLVSGNLAHAPYRVPFAVVGCKGCDTREISLSAETALELVTSHRSLEEARLWLRAHSSHASASVVSALATELEAERDKANADKAASELQEAQAADKAGELVPALEHAKKCMALNPKEPKCTAVRDAVAKRLSSDLPTTRKAILAALSSYGFKPKTTLKDKTSRTYSYEGQLGLLLSIKEDRRGHVLGVSVTANATKVGAGDHLRLVSGMLAPLTPSWTPEARRAWLEEAIQEHQRSKAAVTRERHGRRLTLEEAAGIKSVSVTPADTPDLR